MKDPERISRIIQFLTCTPYRSPVAGGREIYVNFNGAERAVVQTVRSSLPWNWQRLELKIEFSDSSFISSGAVSRLLAPSLAIQDLRMTAEFHQAAFALRRASLQSEAGPVLIMEVNWQRGSAPAFLYVREAQNVTSISQVPRDVLGRLPMFMFRRSLPASLLREIQPSEVIYAIQVYVAANHEKQISARLRQIDAIHEWLTSVSRGGSDSYFFDGPHRDEVEAINAMLAVRTGLQALGEHELSHAFDESLSVYAPEVGSASKVCIAAKLTPKSRRPSENDDDVNRITRWVQEHADAWVERTGKHIQENVVDYATS